nr:MAG TPA: hypothetical protein [Caudoviricetes sp.]
MVYVSSITRFLDDTPTYSVYRIPAEVAVMNHSEQTLILKLFESLGDDDFGQFRKHPGEILVGHPNPITAGVEMPLPLPLFPVEVVELSVDGCRGESQSLDQFGHMLKIVQDQSSPSMNELKRLRL